MHFNGVASDINWSWWKHSGSVMGLVLCFRHVTLCCGGLCSQTLLLSVLGSSMWNVPCQALLHGEQCMCVMIHQTQTFKSNSPKQMFVLGMAREELRISSGLSGKHLWSTFMYSCHFFFFFHQAFCSFTITPSVYLRPFVSVLSSFCFLFLCFTFHSPCFLNCGEQTSAK